MMQLVTSETLDRPVARGEMVYAVAISGANILRDMREAVINTIGGRMTKYEALLDQTIARALETLGERARAKGYDGVLGVRITHPTITNGAIAVTVSGTGFRFAGQALQA
ncbi:MAG TPA: heavy metal-binding domain-containing protein [Hyphomicrobiaceae bacterium]